MSNVASFACLAQSSIGAMLVCSERHVPFSTRNMARVFTNPVFIRLVLYGLAQQAQFGLARQAQMFGYIQQPLAEKVVAGQRPVLQSMSLQSGPGQQQFSGQPDQFVRQQGLPQLSGPGVVQSSAVQGAVLNLPATTFQSSSVNQMAPIQQAVSHSSGVTLHGASHSERTAAAVIVPGMGRSRSGQSDPGIVRARPGRASSRRDQRIEGLSPGSELDQFFAHNFAEFEKSVAIGSLARNANAWRSLTSDLEMRAVVRDGYFPPSHHCPWPIFKKLYQCNACTAFCVESGLRTACQWFCQNWRPPLRWLPIHSPFPHKPTERKG